MNDFDKLNEAMDQIDDRYLAEAGAARKPKSRRIWWLGTIAAVLAVVIFLNSGGLFLGANATVISAPGDSRAMVLNDDRSNLEAFRDDQAYRNDTVKLALKKLDTFFADSTAAVLSGSQGNQLYSPVNLYMALAMAAELASGNSRQQILDLLGFSSIETLRKYSSKLWEYCYKDGNNKTTLANSLWIHEDLSYDQAVMDNIAYHYYGSVFHTAFGTPAADSAIQNWLNENTHGLLEDTVQGLQTTPDTVLALYSTIYFYARWQDEFDPERNTQDIFHANSGDITTTFMNMKELQSYYYWGDSYRAVRLGLKDGSAMWFILPDADKTVDDVLAEGQYMDMILNGSDNSKYMKVNLSVPKFDVKSQTDLTKTLMDLGVTDIFDRDRADFGEAVNGEMWFTATRQTVRVKIDEEGVEAVAYIEMPGAGPAMPLEEVIDFIVDRPFIFVITTGSVPLFSGVVNQP